MSGVPWAGGVAQPSVHCGDVMGGRGDAGVPARRREAAAPVCINQGNKYDSGQLPPQIMKPGPVSKLLGESSC